jgi:hypothetical protein
MGALAVASVVGEMGVTVIKTLRFSKAVFKSQCDPDGAITRWRDRWVSLARQPASAICISDLMLKRSHENDYHYNF